MEIEKHMRPCEALILQLYCLCRFHNKFNIKLKKQSNEAALEAVNCIFNQNKVKGYLSYRYYILCNAILILNYSTVLFLIAVDRRIIYTLLYIYEGMSRCGRISTVKTMNQPPSVLKQIYHFGTDLRISNQKATPINIIFSLTMHRRIIF